ncbi:hypothetical protein AX774_g7608, partial [Zancudomyces culisetae]
MDGCSNYQHWTSSSVLVDRFELFKKFPGMVFYSEKYYSGDPRTKSDGIMDIHFYLVREVCDDPSSIDGVSIRAMPLESRNVLGETPHNDEGCYFPHLYAGSRRANEEDEGEMRHLLEYRVCERQSDCELKISMIPFEQDRKLPVEEGCSFILYEPIYSNV